jgi:hypothetical protein
MADNNFVKLLREKEKKVELLHEITTKVGDKELEILEKKAEILGVTTGEILRNYLVPTGIFEDVFAEKKAKKSSPKMLRGE